MPLQMSQELQEPVTDTELQIVLLSCSPKPLHSNSNKSYIQDNTQNFPPNGLRLQSHLLQITADPKLASRAAWLAAEYSSTDCL